MLFSISQQKVFATSQQKVFAISQQKVFAISQQKMSPFIPQRKMSFTCFTAEDAIHFTAGRCPPFHSRRCLLVRLKLFSISQQKMPPVHFVAEDALSYS